MMLLWVFCRQGITNIHGLSSYLLPLYQGLLPSRASTAKVIGVQKKKKEKLISENTILMVSRGNMASLGMIDHL